MKKRKAKLPLKAGKVAGVDNIPSEAIHVGGVVSVEAMYMYSLLNRRKEEIQEEWRKGLLIKSPKKGDTTHCKNWRVVTLLAIANKILSRIVLDRMKCALDSLLRDGAPDYTWS